MAIRRSELRFLQICFRLLSCLFHCGSAVRELSVEGFVEILIEGLIDYVVLWLDSGLDKSAFHRIRKAFKYLTVLIGLGIIEQGLARWQQRGRVIWGSQVQLTHMIGCRNKLNPLVCGLLMLAISEDDEVVRSHCC